MPKVGPLSLVAVKGRTKLRQKEYDVTVWRSQHSSPRQILTQAFPFPNALKAPFLPSPNFTDARPCLSPGARPAPPPLSNRDLDTGRVVQPGGYPLTDSTYADLLHRLVQKPTQPFFPASEEDIQKYYSNLDLPITTKKDPDRWKQVLADLTPWPRCPPALRQSPSPPTAPIRTRTIQSAASPSSRMLAAYISPALTYPWLFTLRPALSMPLLFTYHSCYKDLAVSAVQHCQLSPPSSTVILSKRSAPKDLQLLLFAIARMSVPHS